VLLTRIYGDYLALPPEEERDKHKLVLVDLGKYKDALMREVREETGIRETKETCVLNG
jgi:8-oxo-dGTP pyrophosphatase MutT (NUDIX family)